MNKFEIIIFFLLVVGLIACNKSNSTSSLEIGKITIYGLDTKDTLCKEVPIKKDSAIVLSLRAVLQGAPSNKEHIISFKADTSRMSAYRSKYGVAKTLPGSSYLFYRSECRINAGTNISDSIELNLIKQTDLLPETEYVLPVVIRQIDGTTDFVSKNSVLFLVLKTGKAAGYSKAAWTIAAVSSQASMGQAINLLDNNVSTTWNTGSGMPQFVTIDFGVSLEFNKVTYTTPAQYYSSAYNGGFPTQVKIEVSIDGNNWIDKGTYTGTAIAETWIQDIGITTARYLRFNILAVKPLAGVFHIAYIGDIGLAE